MLIIQANFACEFTTAKNANVLLEPFCSTAIAELLNIEGKNQPLGSKSAHMVGHLPAALLLVTEVAHRPSQQIAGNQPTARAILHSAMRVYVIASGQAEE